MLRQAIGLVVCLLIVTSSRVSADVVTFNGSGQPISITGLSIPNESFLFDVTFTYNTSFNSLFGPGNPTPSGQVPYFWGNQTQAFAAGNAIRDAIYRRSRAIKWAVVRSPRVMGVRTSNWSHSNQLGAMKTRDLE